MKRTITLLCSALLASFSARAVYPDPMNLEINVAYAVSLQTPVMPEICSQDTREASAQIRNLPPGGLFFVLSSRSKAGVLWYEVAAAESRTNTAFSGWISSVALLGQQIHAETDDPKAKPVESIKDERLSEGLKAAITEGSGFLTVRNDNAYDWTFVTVSVNPKLFSSGYSVKIARVSSGDAAMIPYRHLVKSDGERFDHDKFAVKEVAVDCRRADGSFANNVWGSK